MRKESARFIVIKTNHGKMLNKMDDLESYLSYMKTIIVVVRKVSTVIPKSIVHIVGIPFNPPSLSLQRS